MIAIDIAYPCSRGNWLSRDVRVRIGLGLFTRPTERYQGRKHRHMGLAPRYPQLGGRTSREKVNSKSLNKMVPVLEGPFFSAKYKCPLEAQDAATSLFGRPTLLRRTS